MGWVTKLETHGSNNEPENRGDSQNSGCLRGVKIGSFPLFALKYQVIFHVEVQDETKNDFWDDSCKGFATTNGQKLGRLRLPGYAWIFQGL